MDNVSQDALKAKMSEFKSITLYINNDSFQNILSDFNSFNSIGECKLNDFLNDLIKKVIEDTTCDIPTITIHPDNMKELKKHNIHSGVKQNFRIKNELRNIITENEVSHNSLFDSINGKHYSIAEIYSDVSGQSITAEYEIQNRSGYLSYLKKYLDALLDKYGQLSQGKREMIFYRKKYDLLSECIKRKNLVEIDSSGKIFAVKPYRLLSDTAVRYLYLTGYAEDKIYTFRFSRLKIINIDKQNKSGELTVDEEEAIKERIKTSGVAYLSEPVEESIEILLTDYGYDLFSKIIIHQRPNLKMNNSRPPIEMLSEQETNKYRIKIGKDFKWRIFCSCTKRQAEQYFLRLGSNAVVVAPENVAKSCAEAAYRSALAYLKMRDETIDSEK